MSELHITADITSNVANENIIVLIGLNGKPVAKFKCQPEKQTLSLTVNDENEYEHYLEFWLLNKKEQDTKIDNEGNIVDDVLIDIKNIKFDDIELDQIFFQQSRYHYLDNQDQEHRFYGTMGCNGVVKFKFTTPFYIWLLENM